MIKYEKPKLRIITIDGKVITLVSNEYGDDIEVKSINEEIQE